MTKHIAPLRHSEATARKYLVLALEQDAHNPLDMVFAYGWLTTVLQALLDSLEAEKATPKPKVAVDPLLREFVGDLAGRLRLEGMPEAADRIVGWTGQSLRIAEEYLTGPVAEKQVA